VTVGQAKVGRARLVAGGRRAWWPFRGCGIFWGVAFSGSGLCCGGSDRGPCGGGWLGPLWG
jgi:hypothetical protein